ncbi:MAG: polyphosphate kinase 2 family protein [Chloroflexi bacterium]|nr:polyphosphate kinase 2 family protein [Chloroflexota bacterium]
MAQYRVEPGTRVDLSARDPDETGPFEKKKKARKELERLRTKLIALQDRFYAWNERSLLIVLQAMDTGGKDGTIKHVMRGVNPQGVQVTSFKAPTQEELAHDYLWRVHKAAPRRGRIGIFNRSHYEDVLVVRVHNLVSESVWSKRYDHINDFERLLADSGTVILKFYLHISREEQARRLQARLDNPDKRWKFSKGDLKERRLWDDYMAAYEDALSRCSTEHAPWYVIPSNRKWYRNLAIMSILVNALEDLNPVYPEPEEGLDHIVIE